MIRIWLPTSPLRIYGEVHERVIMSPEDGVIETELVDLGHCTLHDLRVRQDDDLLAAVGQAMAQVARPRKNLGSSGPPGRAD
jgi:hypothetical protein